MNQRVRALGIVQGALFCSTIVIFTGCNGDITVTETAKCDGIKQRSEDYVDSPFDRDGDGAIGPDEP